MGSVKILDCTLRDGGFVNNWSFGFLTIKEIVKSLNESRIDIIELGFLDRDGVEDYNFTKFNSLNNIRYFVENVKDKKSEYVVMIDYGRFSYEELLLEDTTLIDGIRVIFKKDDMEEALELCNNINKMGLNTYIQPVSITSYSDLEILQLIEKVNLINPSALSIVDTYGLLQKRDLYKYFYLFDTNLNKNIELGYHSHNNFQLAFSNSIDFIQLAKNRDVILDCSLYGMGKNAGNANTELLLMYLNQFGDNYDINYILEIIDTQIMKLKLKFNWGYSFNQVLSAMNDCHPLYVKYLVDKKTLDISKINQILTKIPVKQKLKFDEDLINSLYNGETIDNQLDYSELLQKHLNEKEILILAPGSSLKKAHDLIKNMRKGKVTISLNFVSEDIETDLVFISNQKRYLQIANNNRNIPIIATSNINGKADYLIDYTMLTEGNLKLKDSSLLLLLSLLVKLKVRKVYIAGADGFSENQNYVNGFYELSSMENNFAKENKRVRESIMNFRESIEIEFITETVYLSE